MAFFRSHKLPACELFSVQAHKLAACGYDVTCPVWRAARRRFGLAHFVEQIERRRKILEQAAVVAAVDYEGRSIAPLAEDALREIEAAGDLR